MSDSVFTNARLTLSLSFFDIELLRGGAGLLDGGILLFMVSLLAIGYYS